MGLDLAWLQAFGPTVGLAALLFFLQARGHLVPKRLHDEVRLDRDTYKTAAETALLAAAKASSNVEALTGITAKMADNSEKQLELSRLILEKVSGPAVPMDRSA